MSRVNDFPPSSSWAAAHGGNPPLSSGHGQLRPGYHASFQDNMRTGTLATGHRPFLERVSSRPFGMTSTRIGAYPPQIIIFNNMDHGVDSRLSVPLLERSDPGPLSQGTTHMPADTDESELSKEEQSVALQNLKKHVYSPVTKVKSRRVSLYYRDLNLDVNAKATDEHKDEDGKNCAVCLEDFEPREEVMITPCNHLFHEECIVPWVKSHGKCPVCRSALCQSTRGNVSDFNRYRGSVGPARQPLLADEVLSLFQALDVAFTRGS